MKRFTTILCSIAFMISGFLISFMKEEVTNPEFRSQNQLHAAQPTSLIIPTTALPLDLQLDLAKKDSIKTRIDTVVLHDTVQVVKYKIKYRAPKKKVEPDSLLTPAKLDTLYVPKELKILIQMSKDVLMDTTFVIKPDSNECPKIQPLQEHGE